VVSDCTIFYCVGGDCTLMVLVYGTIILIGLMWSSLVASIFCDDDRNRWVPIIFGVIPTALICWWIATL